MNLRKFYPVITLVGFLLGAFGPSALAQQPQGPVELPSVGHAISRPLTSYKGTTHPKFQGPARVIPLRRPAKAGAGGPSGGPAATGGNWSDADLQTSYSSSQFMLGKLFQAFTFQGDIPPDENLSVGINSTGTNPQTQILSVVNVSYRVFDTSGNLLVQGDLASNLFGTFSSSVCSSMDGGDPIALYDKLDQRWIVAQLAYNSTFTDNHYCLAISQTSDATGAYDLYDIPFGSNLPDYPKLAVWSDGIYFSANIFASNGNTLTFTGAQACSLPRSDVTTSPASVNFTCSPGTDATVYNILPADLEGRNLPPSGTGPDYFLQFEDNLTPTSGNLLRLYQLNGTSLDVVADLTVNTFNEACGGGTCVPQSGTTQLLDSLGDRLMYRLSYRNYGGYQQIVANHSVQVDSSSQQTGIRWYALRSNSGGSPPFTVDKESSFSPDATYYRWMGSIAQDKNGDLGLGYSTSGVTTVPGIAVTGLLNGTDTYMEQEARFYNGSNQSYQGSYSRWGDYSSVSVDPTDDCTFWYTNEYVTPPVLGFDFLWQTVIGSFSFPGCTSGGAGADFSVTPSPASRTITPGGSTNYTITVTSLNGYKGPVTLSYSNCPANAICSLSPTSVTVPDGSFATATLSVTTTSSITPNSYTIPVSATDGTLTHSTSVGLTVSPPPDFSLAAGNSPQTVTQGTAGAFGITVSPVNGFNSNVTLSVTSGCPTSPSGACSFSPSNTISGGSGSATLNVATDTTTTATTYAITISASGGGVTHTAQVSLTVNQAPSGTFSISASPGSLTLKSGQTGSFTVSASPSGGFSSDVTVLANCPTGFSCQISNGGVIPSGSGSVGYLVTNQTAPRRTSYTVTFVATGGGQTQQASVGLKSR
jgi:hypothetical protein